MDQNRINSAKTLFRETEKLKEEQYQNMQTGQCGGVYMTEIPLLSQDQIELLQWFECQTAPMTRSQISAANPVGYTWERVAELEKTYQLISRHLGAENGQLIGLYGINDRGRAVLSKHEAMRRQEAEEKERYRREELRAETQTHLAKSQNRILAVQTVIALVSFVAGLFIEHFLGCLSWLLGLFH